MRRERLNKLLVRGSEGESADLYKNSKRNCKMKIFDPGWLKANWNLGGSDRAKAALMSCEMVSSLIMPKVESFLRARRILEKLEETVNQGENPGKGSKRKLFQESHFFNSELIYFLASTDPSADNLDHSSCVAAYTLLLSCRYGLQDRKTLVDIERGALLHDIGKTGIPENILQKKGILTEEEMEIVRYHPLIGFAMVEEFSFLQGAAEIILFHHEKYDGTGYPFGLSGEEIPLSARLFSLADTLDAITSNRPYQPGRSFEKAFREIERCRGSQFDPQLVNMMENIPAGKWRKIKDRARKALRVQAVN
ncbi:MAG: HD domain-containing protein [Acidobacteriota bacterium]|nr:HD domain-containing protein [Acidobacteriota bacterium]